jgi:hypothetical protein
MCNRFFLICSLLCVAISPQSLAQSSGTPPASKPKQAQPKVEKAAWNKGIGDFTGMSYDDFVSAGLSKLTEEEYLTLMTWAVTRAAQAKDEGMAEVTSYTCGPKLDEATASKVNLVVLSDSDTPSEIVSELRQRLRAISDVQVVFTEKEADLLVRVVGYELKAGTTSIGYAISVMVSTPCTAKQGTAEWPFSMSDHQILETGGKDVKPLIADIVSTIDAKNIEQIRQSHASYLKYIREQKQKK